MKAVLLLILIIFSTAIQAYSTNDIIGTDDRKRITAGMDAFYQTVGTIEFEGRTGYCTGTLISPRHVLTSGHCVISQELFPARKFEAKLIKFSPGRLDNAPGAAGVFRGESIESFDEWLRSGNDEFDVAVIKLDRDVPVAAGSIAPLALVKAGDDLRGVKLYLAGYSAGKEAGSLWEGEGEFVRTFELNQFFTHTIDTESGGSGSLIRRKTTKGWEVVGVHRGAADNLPVNVGILLSRTIRDAINRWIQL